MIDNGNLYPDPAEFRNKISRWEHTHFVDGLLGDFSVQLPDNYFDMAFSISALEHTPRDPTDMVDRICSDIYRIIKPGGYVLHTIDIVPSDNIAERYCEAIQNAGFKLCEEPHRLEWDVSKPNNQILLESLKIVYENYYRRWHKENRAITFYHFGSVVLMATKKK